MSLANHHLLKGKWEYESLKTEKICSSNPARRFAQEV